jgi:hypothetical protein
MTMSFVQELPKEIAGFIVSQFTAEYATVSAAGVPIDTPTLIFPSADLTTLDLMTGLAYPVKAERARKNPKVGLLVEGADEQPVVSIAGLATVRDSDFQANLERYITETIVTPVLDPNVVDWNAVRQALTYLTRILVCITPTHIRWWKNQADMDRAPEEWKASKGLKVAPSDPAPSGKASEAAQWSQPPWTELAQRAIAKGDIGHVTLCDAEGYPLPVRARKITRTDTGFELAVPKGAPWSIGKATLSFRGREMFVGEVAFQNGRGLFRVERSLPILPLVDDFTQVITPNEENKAKLMKRLRHELDRRGKSIPVVPEKPPRPTAGALRRLAGAGGKDPEQFKKIAETLRPG